MENELKRVEREIQNTEVEFESFQDKYSNAKMDLSFAKASGDTLAISQAQNVLNNLDSESINSATKLENLREKAESLKNTIQEIKINPENSIEAKSLGAQLDVAESKLQSSKNTANDFKEEAEEALNPQSNLGNILDSTKSKLSNLGSKIISVFSKKKPFSGISEQLNGISKKIDNFRKKITSLITSAFIFNLLSSGLRNLSNGLISALNSNSQFASSLNQIKANLITTFTPIYNYILPAINTLMSALSRITGTIATFTSSLFGKTVNQSKQSAKALYDQAKAYDNLGKSSEDAKGNLASWDKLEVIGGNDDNSSKGSGNNIDFSQEVQQSGQLLDFLNQLKELVSQNDWGGLSTLLSEKTVSLLNSIVDSIRNIDWVGIGNGISDFLTNIDFSGILVGLVSIFGEAIIGFQNLILAINWATLFQNLSIGVRDAIFKIADYLGQIRWSDIGQKLSDSFTSIDWGGIGSAILKSLWNGLSGIVNLFLSINWEQVGATISEAVHEWINTIVDKFMNTDWEQLGKNIVNAIVNFIKGIDWGQLAEDILNGLASGIYAFIGLIIGAFEAIWNAILDFFGIHSPSTLARDMGINLMTGLLNGIKSLKDSVVNFFKNIWENIKSAFGNVTSWFKNTFSNAWTAVKNVFSTGGKIFDGIKEGISNVFKTVVNGIIGGINKVIAIPFNSINRMLNSIRNVSILGISPFKGFWNQNPLSVPQIPMLAQGAVIPPNAKFLAMLGDQKNGKNLEAPESLIRKIVREESGDKEVILNGTFVIQCGDLELGRAWLKGARLMESKNGKKYLVN